MFSAMDRCHTYSRPPVGAVVPKRDGYVEKAQSPEHRSLRRRYDGPLANRHKADAERNSHRVYRGKSGCESYQPCASFLVIALDRYRYPSKLLDIAEGLGYLHENHATHGNLKGVGVFFRQFGVSPMTVRQSTILVDYDGHARLVDFEFASIAREANSAAQENGCTPPWAAPEILEGSDADTHEADVFGFAMVLIEVGPRALALDCLKSDYARGFYGNLPIQRIRNLRDYFENYQRGTADSSGRGTRTRLNGLGMGHDTSLLGPGPY